MRCKNCPNEFKYNIKSCNRKYCDICRLIVWKRQKHEYSVRRGLKRKMINSQKEMSCLNCSLSLPENSHINRKYCNICKLKKRKITLATKISELLENKIIGPKEISKELNISNGIIRTTVYNMRKSGVNILTINERYVMI